MRQKLKFNNKNNSQGFSFIELILYVALLAIFISGAVLFAWDIIYGRVKSRVQQEVSQNLRLASKRMTYEIRNASDINSVSANEICLQSSDSSRNPIRFYVNAGQLRIGWGGGSLNCTFLTNDEPLTTNQLIVSDLTFEDLSTGGNESKNIRFVITVDSVGGRQESQRSQTYASSVELRTN